MKFKVGDKVKSLGFETKGHVGTIIGFEPGPCGVLIEFDNFVDGHDGLGHNGLRGKSKHCYYCFEQYLIPINQNKIVITSDGTTTLARLYDGNKVIKSAEAKCSPEDTYNFEIGAGLAFERLMGEKKEDKPVKAKEPESTQLYCIKDYKDMLTKGKIYSHDGKFDITYNGGWRGRDGYVSFDDYKKHNPDIVACLVPLIKRPAKVGEWVLISNRSTAHDNAYSNGDVCKAVLFNDFSYDSGLFIETPLRKTHGCNHGQGTAYVYHTEYLVLDGFRGDIACH